MSGPSNTDVQSITEWAAQRTQRFNQAITDMIAGGRSYGVDRSSTTRRLHDMWIGSMTDAGARLHWSGRGEGQPPALCIVRGVVGQVDQPVSWHGQITGQTEVMDLGCLISQPRLSNCNVMLRGIDIMDRVERFMQDEGRQYGCTMQRQQGGAAGQIVGSQCDMVKDAMILGDTCPVTFVNYCRSRVFMFLNYRQPSCMAALMFTRDTWVLMSEYSKQFGDVDMQPQGQAIIRFRVVDHQGSHLPGQINLGGSGSVAYVGNVEGYPQVQGRFAALLRQFVVERMTQVIPTTREYDNEER